MRSSPAERVGELLGREHLASAPMVGGRGADRIVGNEGDDILIAAATLLDYGENYSIFDNSTDGELADRRVLYRDHERSIEAIVAEWTSASLYEDRVENILRGRGSLSGTGVQLGGNIAGDEDRHRITGASGADLFFGSLEDDQLTDLKDEVFIDTDHSNESDA